VELTISLSTDVAANPHAVWSLVSDLPRMGEFSPENIGGHWVDGHGVDGAAGPAVGAEFRGTNRKGSRQWRTKVRIVACEPGRLLTFDVRTPFGVRVSRWSYEITPTDTGCRLTENWYRVGNWVVRRVLGPRVTGREDRPRLQRPLDRAHPGRREARAESRASPRPAVPAGHVGQPAGDR